MSNSTLVLGDGLLGSEIVRQTGWEYLSRKKDAFEASHFIVNYDYREIAFGSHVRDKGINTIINCIGYTNTYDEEESNHWNVNYIFAGTLALFCKNHDLKLVHISTDYIYAGSQHLAKETDVPIHARNWYSYTKLLADAYVQATVENHLVIRTSFKPRPFPYEYAIMTQMGNFDYVDVIAGLIIRLIEKDARGIFNVGTKTKTIFDLAKQTVPNIMPSNEILHPTMPLDITMNTKKMEDFLNED